MNLIQWSIVAATALSGTSAPAQTHGSTDRIEYRLGGVMSGPTEVIVDMTTGKATNTEPIYAPVRSVRTATGTLTSDQLDLLRTAARKAIADGLEIQKCIDARKPSPSGKPPLPMMPIMDAIPDLRIYIDGQSAFGSMVITCWSKSANDFVGTLMQVAPK